LPAVADEASVIVGGAGRCEGAGAGWLAPEARVVGVRDGGGTGVPIAFIAERIACEETAAEHRGGKDDAPEGKDRPTTETGFH
jgi:hypothetical protein